MIGDGGMPIPKGVEIVDLALCGGVPTFRQVMDAILDEAEIEQYTIANEIEEKNPVPVHMKLGFQIVNRFE